MKLTIKSLSLGDFGNYRCISKNSLGETEGSIRVYGMYFVKYYEQVNKNNIPQQYKHSSIHFCSTLNTFRSNQNGYLWYFYTLKLYHKKRFYLENLFLVHI